KWCRRGWSRRSPAPRHDGARVRALFSAGPDGRAPGRPGGHATRDDRAPLERDGAAAPGARAAARPAVPHVAHRPRRHDVRDRVHGDGGAQRRAPACAFAGRRGNLAGRLARRDRSVGTRLRAHGLPEGARAAARARAGRRLRTDARAGEDAAEPRAVFRSRELRAGDQQAPADQHTGDLAPVRARDPAGAHRARGRRRSALAAPRRDALARGSVERAARRAVRAARRATQLDGVVPEAARRQDLEDGRERPQGGGLDHRRGVWVPQGDHDPDRSYGRPHGGGARRAACAARRAGQVTLRVVVADRVAEGGLQLLAATPDIEVASFAGKPREELERALAGAEALIVRSETRVTADLLTRAPHLRVIARAGTGVDNIDVPAATRRGIAVMNAPGANTVSAAEHAMGLLLGLVRHIPWAAEAMRRGEWDRKRFEGTELRGKTIGVVGLGRIGGHVGQLARAFGMQVVGHDPYLAPERAAELQVKLLPLDQLLRQADVVTLHVAYTEQTHHLINAERLRLMKPGAVLISTARGELVDEGALAEAVREKRIRGAAIDVFAVEPLPADSPLRQLDRVILTPHLAASTAEAQERVSLEVCTAVREALLAGDLSFAL